MKKKGVIFFSMILILAIILTVNGATINQPDADSDGVSDNFDLCPNSKSNEPVDKNGCDAFQFCGKFSCGSSCYYADFKNDEPNQKRPYDCTIVIIAREGKYYPKCVPLNEECGNEYKDTIIKIPEQKINMSVNWGDSINAFWITTLKNVPAGFGPINNSKYSGWCAEEDVMITPKENYTAMLYSSLDPNLATKCPLCYDEDWDKINYIINNKHPNATRLQIQDAIWCFIDGGNCTLSSPIAQQMITQANLYGNGFRPSKGQLLAVIVKPDYATTKRQITFIEVDP